MRRFRIWPWLIVLCTSCISCSCGNEKDDATGNPLAPAEPSTAPVTIQGLTPEDRAVWYRTSMGSDLFPLEWLEAITVPADGKPFLSEADRFGLLTDPEHPSDLPIGLTVNDHPRGLPKAVPMVGVSCAACHVGRIDYKGKSKIVIGAPNLFDLNAFYAELFQTAAKEPAAIIKFLEKTGGKIGSRAKSGGGSVLKGLGKLYGEKAAELGDAEKAFAKKLESLVSHVESDLQKPQNFTHFTEEAKAALLKKIEDVHGVEIDSLVDDLKSGKFATGALKEVADVKDAAADQLKNLLLEVAFLKAKITYLKDLNKLHQGEMQGKTIPEPGPGRIDAFDGIRDLVFADDPVPPTAPVSYPHLWQVADTYWFHWDGNTNSLMQRNVGQAVGMGAVYDPKTWSSTVLPRNIDKLEKTLHKLKPPEWPEEMLGPIDKEKFARGEVLYKKLCVECHQIPPKPSTESGVEPSPFAAKSMDLAKLIPLDKVKTDPNRVVNFAKTVGGVPFAQKLKEVAYNLTNQAFIDNDVTDKERALMDRPEAEVDWPVNNGYLARPLVASWATAPYLHNGSVPTLYDLLSPSDKRPKQFVVGYREFDPVKVGFVSDPKDVPKDLLGKPPITIYSVLATKDGATTPIEGNSNSGHDYGVDLDDKQKMDLIEYLKGT